jgi:toxin ParE1/3/4
MSIVWSRQARRDLRAIHDFIARDSEHYADLQISRIIERVEYISKMPTLGHRVHEYPELDLRETHQGSYRIIYAHENTELRVVTIIHMKQQMKSRRLSK